MLVDVRIQIRTFDDRMRIPGGPKTYGSSGSGALITIIIINNYYFNCLGLEVPACGADGHLSLRRGLPQADGALPHPGHGGGPQLRPGPSPQVLGSINPSSGNLVAFPISPSRRSHLFFKALFWFSAQNENLF
jgi:hypothetical protein